MKFLYHLSLPIQLSTEAKSVLIASLLILYCLLQWKKKTNTKAKQPPLPSNSWPIIGHLHLLKGLPHIALGKLADQYGPIFMFKFGVRRALVVSSAEMARECLTGANDSVFLNRPRKIYVEHLAYNSAMFVVSPYGEYWRKMRKITTHELLSNHRVEMLKDVRISEVRSAIRKLSDAAESGSVVDMKQWFGDVNLDIIVRLVSGKSFKEYFNGEEYDQSTRAFRDFFELAGAFVPSDALPFLRSLDIGGYEKRMKKCAKEVDIVAQRWLEEHKKRRGSKERQENQDLMDVMLDIFESGKEKPSCQFDDDTIVKATCMLMILGGGDTIAVTLIWALSLLLNNKDVLKKTQAELDNVVGKERKVEESDLKKLVFLQAVLKETMRIYPTGPLSVPREAITECRVNGFQIPAGTHLLLNLYKIQRDPQVWEDPLIFNPERFLTNDIDYYVRGQSYEFMPFGSGKRICPGISYSLHVMHFTLANLLHGFDVSLPSVDQTVDMTEGFGLSNLKATPLEVILTRRLPHNLYN